MRAFFAGFTYAVGLVLVVSLVGFTLSVPPRVLFEELLSEEVLLALKLSLWTSLLATAVVFPAAVLVGYSLARFELPLKRVLKTVVDLPMAFPELLLGLVLLVLFSDLLDPLLGNFSPVFSPAGVVLAEAAVAFPFAARVSYAAFLQVDPRYEAVARTLGYGPFETFLKVSLPLARGGLLAALVLAFARAFGAFGAVLVFAGAVYKKTETLPIGMYLNLSYGNLERAVAMGALLMAVSFLAVFALESFQKDGVARFGGN
ncbi:MAG: ABC transporter permease subunit [Aquificae bacterium]|nr:ABC transporter permease subunit [Aquificota bacterium]